MNFRAWEGVWRRAVAAVVHLAGAAERLGFQPDEAQARLLDGAPHRLILNCTRQWGKSTVTAAAAVWRAESRAGSLTIVASPCERQSREFLRKAKQFVRALGYPVRGDGDNAMSLVLPNGSRIVGLPGNPDLVRGFSAASLVIIDEAARVSDDLYRTLRPMLAASDGDLWLMSTPRGKRGFFYETWVNGGEDWERVSVPATSCARILPAFLEEERQVLGDFWFVQEYLCEFSDVESSLFDRDTLMGLFTGEVEPIVV